MLTGQYGGRHQDSGLLAVQHALHHGPEGYLRLSVAHVATEEAVHWGGPLHICFDLLDAAQLVLRLGVFELLLELPLPWGIRRKGISWLTLSLGVELNKPLGQVLNRFFGPGLGLLPLGAPQFVQLLGLRRVLAAANVLGHHIQLGGWDIEHIGAGIGDLHIVLLHAVYLHFDHTHIAAHSMVLMNHQVAGGQVGVGLQLLPVGGVFPGPRLFDGPRVALCDDGQLDGWILHSPGQAAHGDDRLPRPGQLLHLEIHSRLYLLLPEQSL